MRTEHFDLNTGGTKMRTDPRIPFLDLVAPHAELKEELCSVFSRVLDTAGFIGGPMVENFENDFSKFCGVNHCVGVANGTDALRFALIAAGLGTDEIVLTAPNTFIATTEAITQAGGSIDFVDVDEKTYNLDPLKLQAFIDSRCSVDRRTGALTHRESGRRVAAIVPVHLYGQMADMDPIIEIAERHKLIVVEDACQAHGAEYYSRKDQCWKRAGSIGVAAAFSFYPGKNLGACGEAGAITTNDHEVARRIRMLRDHGQSRKYYHEISGYNGRLDALQAGILNAKLKHLADWNEKRRVRAEIYGELFTEAGRSDIPPFMPNYSRSVYHLYVIRDRNRNSLIRELSAEGVDTGIHYPVPLHLQNAYKHLGFKPGDFPIAEQSCSEILSLPMFPQLTRMQQERVVNSVVKLATRSEVLSVQEQSSEMVASF
jgi:dTDP-4-amino-4,6-dideoxygalactose transaminase